MLLLLLLLFRFLTVVLDDTTDPVDRSVIIRNRDDTESGGERSSAVAVALNRTENMSHDRFVIIKFSLFFKHIIFTQHGRHVRKHASTSCFLLLLRLLILVVVVADAARRREEASTAACS